MVVSLTAQQLADLLVTQDLDLVDVREEHDWSQGHVPGARSLTLDQLRADPDQTLPRRDGIVFVCARGVRSLTAAKLADRLGYTTVYSLEGGTTAWVQAGYDLVVERRAA